MVRDIEILNFVCEMRRIDMLKSFGFFCLAWISVFVFLIAGLAMLWVLLYRPERMDTKGIVVGIISLTIGIKSLVGAVRDPELPHLDIHFHYGSSSMRVIRIC